MFVVYWLEAGEGGSDAFFEPFAENEMSAALRFMEELRVAQREGTRPVAFVTMCSENPNSVGKPGASDPGADYNWTKRRGNMPRAKNELNKENYRDY